MCSSPIIRKLEAWRYRVLVTAALRSITASKPASIIESAIAVLSSWTCKLVEVCQVDAVPNSGSPMRVSDGLLLNKHNVPNIG